MADLERISLESFNNALTKPSSDLARRLPKEELTALGIIRARTAKRYPAQENGETIEEYLTDFEQLSLKYSLQKVEDALSRLRIDSDQRFFPTPNEVAHEIENEIDRRLPSHIYAQR